MADLAMNMTESGRSGYRDLEFWASHAKPRLPGLLHSANASNVDFSEADVRDDLEEVLYVMKRQAKEAKQCITQLAMYGRFGALIRAGKCKCINTHTR